MERCLGKSCWVEEQNESGVWGVDVAGTDVEVAQLGSLAPVLMEV